MNSFDLSLWGAIAPYLDGDMLVRLARTGDKMLHRKLLPWITEITLDYRLHFLTPSWNMNAHFRALSLVLGSKSLVKLTVPDHFRGSFVEGEIDWSPFVGGLKELHFQLDCLPLLTELLLALREDRFGPSDPLSIPQGIPKGNSPTLTSFSASSLGSSRNTLKLLEMLPSTLTSLKIGSNIENSFTERPFSLRHLSRLETLRLPLLCRNLTTWTFLPPSITKLDFPRLGSERTPSDPQTIATLFPSLVELITMDMFFHLSKIYEDDYIETNGGFPTSLRRLEIGPYSLSRFECKRLAECLGHQLLELSVRPEVEPRQFHCMKVATVLSAQMESHSFQPISMELLPPSLTSLSCQFLSNAQIDSLPRTLTNLQFSVKTINDQGPTDLRSLPIDLTSLTLTFKDALPSGYLRSIPAIGISRLELQVDRWDSPTQNGRMPQDISHLTSLTFLKCTNASDVPFLTEPGSALSFLSFLRDARTTPIFQMASQLPINCLDHVEMGCLATTHALFKSAAFAQSQPRLRELALFRAFGVQGAFPLEAFSFLPSALQALEIHLLKPSDCTKDRIKALPRSLKRLRLTFSDQCDSNTFDAECLRHLPPYLTSLYVYRCLEKLDDIPERILKAHHPDWKVQRERNNRDAIPSD